MTTADGAGNLSLMIRWKLRLRNVNRFEIFRWEEVDVAVCKIGGQVYRVIEFYKIIAKAFNLQS